MKQKRPYESEKSDANLIKHFCSLGHYNVLEHCSATFRIMGGSEHSHTNLSGKQYKEYGNLNNFK